MAQQHVRARSLLQDALAYVEHFLTGCNLRVHITTLDMELALLQTARITKVMRSKTRGAGTMQTL